MTSSDIDRVAEVCGSLGCWFQPTRGRGKKICSLCHLSFRNSFAVRSLCLRKLCRRKWTREAMLMYLPRVPRHLSLVKIWARSLCPSSPVTHVLHSPLCQTMPETKRLGRGLLMYHLAGRYPTKLN